MASRTNLTGRTIRLGRCGCHPSHCNLMASPFESCQVVLLLIILFDHIIFRTIQNPTNRRTWHLKVPWNPERNQTALETWQTFYSGLLDSFDPHLYHWNIPCQWWLMWKPGSKGPWLIYQSIRWRLNATESFKRTGRGLPAYLTKKLDQDRRFSVTYNIH